MSFRPDDRYSFTLSNLERGTQQRQNQQAYEEETNAAAVAGVVGVEALKDHHPAPARLKPARSCGSCMVTAWAFFSFVGLCVLGLQALLVHSMDDDGSSRRHIGRDQSVDAHLEFGLWESIGEVTALQLQVSVSMALGVRANDNDVKIVEKPNHFFDLVVDHATTEELDFVESGAFLEHLNGQLTVYNGRAVMSVPPRLRRVHPIAINSTALLV